ncbi:MAG: ABC transporter permease [Rhodothermales bacterium]
MAQRFNLDMALAAWRRPYEVSRTFSADDLDELEGALIDRIESLQEAGYDDEAAFHEAVRRLGHYGTMERGFQSVYWGKARRENTLGYELNWRAGMLKNYFIIALRALQKQWGYTLINLGGLAVALACVILIGLFLRYELSFDAFHADAEQVYRIYKQDPGSNYLGTDLFAVTPAPLAPTLAETFPEVEVATVIDTEGLRLAQGDRQFSENGLSTTSAFFDVFSFELLHGVSKTALNEPMTIVLTPALAVKLFDDANPVGSVVTLLRNGESYDLTVTGVVEAPPAQSHLQFTFLTSITSDRWYRRNLERGEWDSSNYYTYVKLREEASPALFSEKLQGLAAKHLGELEYYQENPERTSVYYAQPLLDIHLHSRLNFELSANSDVRYVYFFTAIALLILLIACINYTNLATARAIVRAKEVGVRKVLGAHRLQVAGQFMSEALLLCGAGVVLALATAAAAMPLFNRLTGLELTMGSAPPAFWLAIGLVGVLVGLLSGVYPALVMSGFKPAGMVKGVLRHRQGKSRLRNTLVVAQFAVTVVLLMGTLVIFQQLRYVQQANTGIDREHVLTVTLPADKEQYPTIEQQMLLDPNVTAVSATAHSPVRIIGKTSTTTWEGAQEGDRLAAYNTAVQPGFIDLLGLNIVAGTSFTEERPVDEREGYIVNETLVKQLGWTEPIGKMLEFNGRPGRVIGVVEDFNYLSFRQEIEPLFLYVDDNWFSSMLVKVRGEDLPATLNHLEAVMATFVPDYPFDYAFLDDTYARMYASDVRVGQLVSVFTLIAMLIACLGLLGLAAFMTTQRTKEIGVRKVLGASASDVLVLLSKDFTRLVLVALVIGMPVAYYVATLWLQDFAYRIKLGWSTFIGVSVLMLVLAWLTVSYQALRAAWSNPVDALRQE